MSVASGRRSWLLQPIWLALALLPAARPAGAYSVPVTIDDRQGVVALADYPVRLELREPVFEFAQARPDGSDLRVLGGDGRALPFWIESWDAAAGCASIWVRIPAIAPGSQVLIQLSCGAGSGDADTTGASDASATFPWYDGFESTGLNAAQPLEIPTYDGSGQATHPDVVEVPNGWNGWRYWMVMTPYPFNVESLENPSIVVSQDGQHWQAPDGLVNPIVGPVAGYNNDPDLLLVGDTLMVYYNETLYAGTTDVRRVTSTDGVHWSAPVSVLHLDNYEMSPAIVQDADGWHMLYATSVQGCYAARQTVVVRRSDDGLSWSDAEVATFSDSSVVPWHFNVSPSEHGGYTMLVACYPPGSTCDHTDLYYATSDDYLHWTLTPQPILRHSSGGWDDLEIYRSAFLLEDDVLRIWYAASSIEGQWRIGYTEAPLEEFLAPSMQSWADANGQLVVTDEHARTGNHSLRLDGGSSFPEIARPFQAGMACTAWMYDDLDDTPDRLAVLRVWDSGTPAWPLHAIGVGYFQGCSDTSYSFHTEGWEYTDTGLPRRPGWHRLTIAAGDTACRLLVDDHEVAVLDVLNPAAITQFSLAGYAAGASYFDDAYVRPYVEPEPVAVVGATLGGDLAVPPGGPRGLELSPVWPNPAADRAGVAFTLGRASQVELRVMGLRGERVRTLLSGPLPAGPHRLLWDGRDEAGRPAAAGVYFVSLRADGERRTRRLVLLR